MLLLQKKNEIKKKKNLLIHIYNNKVLNQKLKEKKTIINDFSNTKKSIQKKRFHNLNILETLKYIVGVSFLKKNTIIYITSSCGQLKYQCSAGFLKLNKKQKIKIPFVLIKLTKTLLNKMPYLNRIPIALHLNNIPKPLQFFFEAIFKTQFFIIQLSSFKSFPHNGCRPKKLKRKKKKLFFFE